LYLGLKGLAANRRWMAASCYCR